MTVTINLYGNGSRCWVCEIPNHRYKQLKEVADFHKTSLNNIVFDLEILGRLGYGHWKNIFPIQEINGFLIGERNRIEVKKGNHLLGRFNSNALLSNDLLFKLYNTKEVEIKIKPKCNYKYLLIGQYETGRYRYRLNSNEFDINSLCFSISSSINSEKSIVSLSYNDSKLSIISDDTIIRSFFIDYLL